MSPFARLARCILERVDFAETDGLMVMVEDTVPLCIEATLRFLDGTGAEIRIDINAGEDQIEAAVQSLARAARRAKRPVTREDFCK